MCSRDGGSVCWRLSGQSCERRGDRTPAEPVGFDDIVREIGNPVRTYVGEDVAGEDGIDFVCGECVSMTSHGSCCESLSEALPTTTYTVVCNCRRRSRV